MCGAGGLRYLGFGAMLQGAFLVVMAFVSLGSAVRVAEILYAEDFDRSGWVPTWFGPWHFAMNHPLLAVAILSAVGLAVLLAGALCVSGVTGSSRWLEWGCWAGAMGSCLLVAALTPLHLAGSDWPAGTPAQDLRRELLVSIGAVGLEILLLVGTIVAVRRMQTRGTRAARAR